MTRREMRRVVSGELNKVRSYRRMACAHNAHACTGARAIDKTADESAAAWVEVCDLMLDALRREDVEAGQVGQGREAFARLLFGVDAPKRGNTRRVMMDACDTFHRSLEGLYSWRSDALFLASVYAAERGLLREPIRR